MGWQKGCKRKCEAMGSNWCPTHYGPQDLPLVVQATHKIQTIVDLSFREREANSERKRNNTKLNTRQKRTYSIHIGGRHAWVLFISRLQSATMHWKRYSNKPGIHQKLINLISPQLCWWVPLFEESHIKTDTWNHARPKKPGRDHPHPLIEQGMASLVTTPSIHFRSNEPSRFWKNQIYTYIYICVCVWIFSSLRTDIASSYWQTRSM